MSLSSLHLLAEQGLKSGVDLGEAASAAWEYGENTGDGRYFVLARLACELGSAFEDYGGALPSEIFDHADSLLRRLLPDALSERDPAEATSIAVLLRSQVVGN